MAKQKDFFDDIASWFGDGGDFVDNWDPGVMGDPNAFGLIDWSNIPGWDMPNDIGSGDGSGANWGNGSNPNWGLGDHSGDGADGSSGMWANWGDGSSGGSGGNSLWSQIARLFGGSNGGGTNGGAGGGLNLGSLLPLLAITGGGINQNSNINHATDAMLAANNNATSFLQGQLGATSGRFDPYTNAGAGALQRIQAMPPSNIAAGFKPLGSGRGIVTLGSLTGRK